MNDAQIFFFIEGLLCLTVLFIIFILNILDALKSNEKVEKLVVSIYVFLAINFFGFIATTLMNTVNLIK